jgi:hypothetical protein
MSWKFKHCIAPIFQIYARAYNINNPVGHDVDIVFLLKTHFKIS